MRSEKERCPKDPVRKDGTHFVSLLVFATLFAFVHVRLVCEMHRACGSYCLIKPLFWVCLFCCCPSSCSFKHTGVRRKTYHVEGIFVSS